MTEPSKPELPPQSLSTPPPMAYAVPPPASNAPFVAIGIGIGVVILVPVAIAIVGILAAIAIPNFIKFNQRSYAAEAKTNVRALATAEEAYRLEHDVYLAMPPTPRPKAGREPSPWESNEAAEALGFQPGPRVRYSYEVQVDERDQLAVITARGDLDGDGTDAVYRIELSPGTIGPMQEPDRSEF